MYSIISFLTLDHTIHIRLRLEIVPHFCIFTFVIVAIAPGEFITPTFTVLQLFWGKIHAHYYLNSMLVLLERNSFSQTLLDGGNTWLNTGIHYELPIPSLITFLWTQVHYFIADISTKLLHCLSYQLLSLKSPLSWTVNYMRVSANAVNRSIWVDTPSELVAPTC